MDDFLSVLTLIWRYFFICLESISSIWLSLTSIPIQKYPVHLIHYFTNIYGSFSKKKPLQYDHVRLSIRGLVQRISLHSSWPDMHLADA